MVAQNCHGEKMNEKQKIFHKCEQKFFFLSLKFNYEKVNKNIWLEFYIK